MLPRMLLHVLFFVLCCWQQLPRECTAIRVLPRPNGEPHVMYRVGKPVYVVVNDTSRHMIPDRYTMNVLGHWAHHEIKQMDKAQQARYPKGDNIETLWNTHPNAAVLALLNKGPRLVQETYPVFTRLLNPSTIWRRGEAFISGRWADDEKYQNMFWLNAATPVPRGASYEATLRALSRLTFNTSVVPHGKVFGEDPRLFVMSDDRVFVIICHRFLRMKPELQMAYAELIPHDHRIEVGPLVDIKFKDAPKDDQKNWSPFEYNGTLLFIQSVQPHRVVRTTAVPPLAPDTDRAAIAAGTRLRAFTGPTWYRGYPETWPGEDTKASRALSKVVEGTTAALTTMTRFVWPWGQMRGGTPALLVPTPLGERYLTFFHSSNDPPNTGRVLRTYVFGAYVFDPHPPFAIRAISPSPIVHETMYSGPWANLPRSYYHIDYVAFPMSYVVENGSVVLLYGKQDADAWVAKINLQGLLASLVPVETRVDVDVYHAAGGGHSVGGHRKKPLQQLLASPTGSVQ